MKSQEKKLSLRCFFCKKKLESSFARVLWLKVVEMVRNICYLVAKYVDAIT